MLHGKNLLKYKIFIILIFISQLSFTQNFRGLWKGQFQNSDSIIPVQFNVMIQKDSMVGVIMQKPYLCSFTDSSYVGDTLQLKSAKYRIAYNCHLTDNKNQLTGEFVMNGKYYHLEMSRGNYAVYRPQEPKKPYPYYSEDVVFFNKNDSTRLAGTLTIPDKKGEFPAVVLIGGSYPTNRNGESNHHKMFLVLADYLTRNGIAVLRYDARGVNKSSGNFHESTPADFAKDVISGYHYLAERKEINRKAIGLIGHSEGGLVASIAGSLCHEIDFIVLLASPGIMLKEIFLSQLEQNHKSLETSKENYEFWRKFYELCYLSIEQGKETKAIKDTLNRLREEYLNLQPKPDFIDYAIFSFYEILNMSASPHNQFCITCNPSYYLEKVICPVLSLNGNKDFMVEARINQDAIRKALIEGGNKDFELSVLDRLNHSFQECRTGSIREYGVIEQTFSPRALNDISDWILKHAKKAICKL